MPLPTDRDRDLKARQKAEDENTYPCTMSTQLLFQPSASGGHSKQWLEVGSRSREHMENVYPQDVDMQAGQKKLLVKDFLTWMQLEYVQAARNNPWWQNKKKIQKFIEKKMETQRKIYLVAHPEALKKSKSPKHRKRKKDDASVSDENVDEGDINLDNERMSSVPPQPDEAAVFPKKIDFKVCHTNNTTTSNATTTCTISNNTTTTNTTTTTRVPPRNETKMNRLNLQSLQYYYYFLY